MPGTQLSIKNCYHSYHKLGCLARFSCARVNTSLVSFPDTLTLSLIYCMPGTQLSEKNQFAISSISGQAFIDAQS